MEDGETIAAWLPQAEIELGLSAFGSLAQIQVPAPSPASASNAATPTLESGFGLFDPPDVTVIGSDGKQLLAKYVGLDAVTGLSILKLVDKNPLAGGAIKEESVDVGESVRLVGPEPVTAPRGFLNTNMYVRIGATAGRVQNVRRAPTGVIARFKVSSPRLSQAIVGGVVINDAGETLGIVDGLEGSEATILPAALIRRAAQRVLERQASVPKPWLGVRGEAVAGLKVEQIRGHGWIPERAEALVYDHRGILVTAIVPDSPAAQAALRVGDVILKVNDLEIANGEDFTWLLEQAGPSSLVSFTVARPDSAVEEALDVKLSGRLDPRQGFNFRIRKRSPDRFSLIEQGIETIALRPPVAQQLGTTTGLLVVYVEPASAAFAAGLKPGDVIQSINGKSVFPFRLQFLDLTDEPTFKFGIMRNKQRRTVTFTTPPKKQ
jgi:serine protease Do